MDTSEYLPMFLAECREHLQELNLCIVRIKEAPDDKETVDQIFRIAHTLKGMAGTMGFNKMASLTHKMEDVLELLKQRGGGLSRDAVDVLLECLDTLSVAVDSIDTSGEEGIDASQLVVRLEGLVADDAPGQAAAPVAAAAVAIDTGGRRVLRVAAELSAGVPMPSVRALMVLTALAEHGEVVASVPTEDELDGWGGSVVEVWLATEHEEDAVAAKAAAVSDVETVSVAEHVEGAAADAPAPADEAPAAPAAPAAADAPAAPAAPAGDAPAAGGHKKGGTATVRVDAERLDQLMHLMGELVVARSRVEELSAQAGVPGLSQAIAELARSSQSLQAMVMQVRMIPVEAVFLRFPRLVRDLSSKLDKRVELVLTGKETELDRTVVDALGDPMVHLVRNALDHGLETAAERVAAGKPEQGTLEISAAHQGGNVVISVRDDGKGIDPARVAQKAAERGLIAADQIDQVDMPRAIELLFSAGFSTADVTTDISGRGVGMDAVRTMVRELGGEVFMTSETGKGTSAQIRLPLTLAIMIALLVEAGGVPLAIPLDRVERTLRLSEHPVRSVTGIRTLVLRDGVLPLVDLSRSLGYQAAATAEHAVIVRGGDRRFALAVDQLVGQRELVTRPLPNEVGDRAALSGGAVLSNGEIALIVDCDAIADGARANSMPAAYAA
ncbi:MAG: chemotaxis protein CheA [Thermoleophilia bacterium]